MTRQIRRKVDTKDVAPPVRRTIDHADDATFMKSLVDERPRRRHHHIQA